jgi:diacylglycerol kinase (ATP)
MPTPLLILNPEAGGIRGDPRLLSTLQAHPLMKDVVLATTAGEGEIRALARQAREEGRPRLLVGGGDGTVHAAVNGLLEGLDPNALPPAESLPTLFVLPLGTGNDLVRSLGFPMDPWKAMDALNMALTRPMDLIRVDAPCDEWCVNAVAGGFAVREEATPGAEAKAALGILAYLRRGLDALDRDPQLYDVSLTLDEEARHAFRARSVIVGNGRFAGGGVPLTPTASLDDGLLDLFVLPDLDLAEMGLLLPRLLIGHHQDQETIFVRRARRVELSSKPALDLSLDGELAQASQAAFEVVRGVLKVAVGPDEETRAFSS